jgi:hypothetical protein
MRPRIAFSRGATSKNGARTRAHSESLPKIVNNALPFRIRIPPRLYWVKIRAVRVISGSKTEKKLAEFLRIQ